MKFRIKQFYALLLAMLMAVSCTLSVVGLAEEDIVIDQSSKEGISLFDFPDDVEEMPKEVEANSLLAPLTDTPSESVEPSDTPSEGFEPSDTPSESLEPSETSIQNASSSKITLGVKETYKIDTSDLGTKLTFNSSKPQIASVSKKGVITAKKTGKAKITIKNKSDSTVATFTVTVKNAPDKVTLNKTKATLDFGDSLQLKAKLPKNTASNKITWKSSNKKVVTVDNNGLVTTVGAGTAKITVKTFNGKKATCKITVKKTSSVSVDKTSVSVDAGSSVRVTVTCLGEGDIRWSSSDEKVAICTWEDGWDGDTTGLFIKGVSAGSAVITVTDDETGDTAKIKVTVKKGTTVSELLNIFFKTIRTANSMLADKLEYYKESYYSNGYFMVELDDDDEISLILLTGGNGKYTLNGVYPGESLSSAVEELYDSGWELVKDESQTGCFCHDSLPNFVYYLKYSSGRVEYVALVYMG